MSRATTSLDSKIADLIAAERLGPSFARTIAAVYRPLASAIATLVKTKGPGRIVGICGSQGSGKSTGAGVLRLLLEAEGFRVAVLSLDDLYLEKEARAELAARVHPLLATRGPPGTHDVGLGHDVLDSLLKPGTTRVPRFDKSRDTRFESAKWETFEGPADIVLFEGWFVGATAQKEDALRVAANRLEAEEDAQGTWRRFVNAALARDYQALFARIDYLILLKAPSFEVVPGWRMEQEEKLRARAGDGNAVMDRAQVERFVQHYERITRHIFDEMPDRADAVVELDRKRQASGVRLRSQN